MSLKVRDASVHPVQPVLDPEPESPIYPSTVNDAAVKARGAHGMFGLGLQLKAELPSVPDPDTTKVPGDVTVKVRVHSNSEKQLRSSLQKPETVMPVLVASADVPLSPRPLLFDATGSAVQTKLGGKEFAVAMATKHGTIRSSDVTERIVFPRPLDRGRVKYITRSPKIKSSF